MEKDRCNRIAVHIVLAILLGLCLMSALACSTKLSAKASIEITGVVTNYQDNTLAKGIEVRLYSYHPNPVLEYLPPTGHILDTEFTNEEGKFKFEVGSDLLVKLEKQGYHEVVVYVAPGISGFQVIDLADRIPIVNLAIGAPAPAGMK